MCFDLVRTTRSTDVVTERQREEHHTAQIASTRHFHQTTEHDTRGTAKRNENHPATRAAQQPQLVNVVQKAVHQLPLRQDTRSKHAHTSAVNVSAKRTSLRGAVTGARSESFIGEVGLVGIQDESVGFADILIT
jgi:chromatin remodeling complex protein RSC6